MSTKHHSHISIAGLIAIVILSTRLTAEAATIVGPYTNDAFTLHLWHMDASAVPVPDVATGGTNLIRLANGATLGTNSFTGFGSAVSTIDGGQNGIAAGNTDAYLSPNSAPPANVSLALADPTTGAFTMEAIVWIGFDPTKNFGTAGVGGNGRNTPCQLMSGESNTNANRIFQWRIAPLQTANANTTVRLEFNNVNLGGASQLLSFSIPTTGPDAIASNNWYHVAVTYNGLANTTSNFNFYWTLLDGTRTNADLLASTNNLRSLPVAPTVLGVGNLPGRTANNNFLGLIDEVRISSIARAPTDMMFSGPAPVILSASQPASQSVALGQPATFSVTGLGLDPLSYQWQVNGTNIPSATTNPFTIGSAQLTDAGPYDVIITNSYGSVTSSVATLNVGSPVTVSAPQPTNQTVAVGQSAAITVTAGGASPFFYQWRQGGTNVSGATQSTYAIAAAQLTNTGLYDVLVSNNFGSVTSTVATLTVRTPSNLTWLGLATSDWNTNDVNWLTDTSMNVAYATGDNVTFDINGSGVPSVTLDDQFSPSSVLVNADNNYTFTSSVGGGIVGSSRLTKNGAGTLVLDVDNSYTGPTVIQNGILQLGAADAHGTFGKGPITNNSVIVVNRTGVVSLTNVLTGAGSITNQLQGGTISISGANNTLSGPITLNAGTLSLVGPQAAGNTTNFTLNAQTTSTGNSTILQLSSGATLGSNVTLSLLGTVDVPSDFRCSLNTGSDSSTNVLNCAMVLGGSGAVQWSTAGTSEMDIYSSITQPDFTGKIVLRGTGGVGHIYGTINIPSANHVSKTDAGTWVIHSTGNVWTNSNFAQGTVRLATNNALPSALILTLASGCVLDLGGFNQQIGGLIDGGGVEIITNTSTTSDCVLTLNSALSWSYGGVIQDSVAGGHKTGLTVTGGGTLTLTGASTFSGDATVSAGTLALSGAGTINSTSGSIILTAGTTFDVSGVTSSPYHIRTGKTFVCGGVSGGANVNGALVENGGGFLSLNYMSGTPALNVTGGQFTLSGDATTVTVSGSPLSAGSYRLISAGAGGSVAGTLPPSVTVGGSGLAAGTSASLRITSGELWMDVATPQPILITSTSFDGTNLIFNGTNGIAGNTYYVLASTNVATPLTNWVFVVTNTFDGNGAFSVTNLVSSAIPARFYILRSP